MSEQDVVALRAEVKKEVVQRLRPLVRKALDAVEGITMADYSMSTNRAEEAVYDVFNALRDIETEDEE